MSIKLKTLAKQLSNGLITGAADDDPSGIATYSQTGAQYGNSLLWTLILTTPLMVGIQLVSARIGWVTGKGLASAICEVMPKPIAIILVMLVIFANTLNIAADIGAMGEALQLVVGGGEHGHALVFGLLCTILPIWLNYEKMVRVLKWLTFSLFSYVAVLMTLQIDWSQTFFAAIFPKFQSNSDYWMMVVAVLGTTISPYLFFWQAAQEAELRQSKNARNLQQNDNSMQMHLARIRLDTNVGMLMSNFIAFCIMVSTTLTLHQHGIIDIQSTKQAAEALRPIAGEFTFLLFALGIIGTGMLAVPVLAGSAAYALAEVFQWKSGLNHTINKAPGFYLVIIIATIGGTLLDFTSLDPMKALVWSAIVNGVVAVPVMAVMMWLSRNPKILGNYTLNRGSSIIGWTATAIMLIAVVAMGIDFVKN